LGTVDEALIEELLAHGYFAREPPKSTGREVFGAPFVRELVERHLPQPNDLVATLTELTVRAISGAIRRWVAPRRIDEVLVTGAARAQSDHHGRIALGARADKSRHRRSARIDPDAKEAVAFAALAWAHVHRIPGNVPEATGPKVRAFSVRSRLERSAAPSETWPDE